MPEVEIAKEYYAALYSRNYERVRELASLEMKFFDPTVEGVDLPLQINSLEEFLSYMKVASEEIEAEVSITDSFHSNGKVILYVELGGTAPAKHFGGKSGRVRFASRGFSVIGFSEGRIIEHIDYLDYPMLAEIVKKQL